MPLSGNRHSSSSNPERQGTYGYYWTSKAYTSYGTIDKAYYTSLNENKAPSASSVNGTAMGQSIRCFKNSPVIPDSTWVTLYDGSAIAANA